MIKWKCVYSLDDFDQVKDKIYPLIKPIYYWQYQNESVPHHVQEALENTVFLSDKITDDLALFYGIDMGNSYDIISNWTFPDSITQDIVKIQALENIRKLIGDNITFRETDFGGYMLICGYNFEATLIFAEGLWDGLRKTWNHDFLIAIPARDLLFIVKKDDPISIDKLKWVIEKIHKDKDVLFPLSKKIYQFSWTKLVEYQTE